jgi:hypothetical protein
MLLIQDLLQCLTSTPDKRHHITVLLASWTKYTDVATITIGTMKTAYDKTSTGASTHWVLLANVDTEWFVRCCLTQPRFEVV